MAINSGRAEQKGVGVFSVRRERKGLSIKEGEGCLSLGKKTGREGEESKLGSFFFSFSCFSFVSFLNIKKERSFKG